MSLTIADRVEIADLVARYMHALDRRDAEALAATFAEDGVLDVAGRRIAGRGALLDFVRAGTGTFSSGSRHWSSNLVIDGDGDAATASCYMLVVDANDQGRVAVVGRYDDELRKVNGAWRFTNRRITFDYYEPGLRS